VALVSRAQLMKVHNLDEASVKPRSVLLACRSLATRWGRHRRGRQRPHVVAKSRRPLIRAILDLPVPVKLRNAIIEEHSSAAVVSGADELCESSQHPRKWRIHGCGSDTHVAGAAGYPATEVSAGPRQWSVGDHERRRTPRNHRDAAAGGHGASTGLSRRDRAEEPARELVRITPSPSTDPIRSSVASVHRYGAVRASRSMALISGASSSRSASSQPYNVERPSRIPSRS
jgi:hypothetical protein